MFYTDVFCSDTEHQRH